jgi:hypothetical protein
LFSAEKNFHPYDYPDGYIPKRCPQSGIKIFNKGLSFLFLIRLLVNYKYFIFLQAGWTLMKDCKDIRILKFFGKKTMLILVGCDARVPEKVNWFKWNPCSGCPDDYKKFVSCDISKKKILIPKLEKIFDFISSPEECAGLLNYSYHKTFFPRNLYRLEPYYSENLLNRKIKILHAPSNKHYKGTKFIREVVENLSKTYDNFEYVEKQGMSISDLYTVISSFDLIIDQVIVGYYGLFSVESMALGKPVVVYIRPDIWDKERSFSPVYNANPDNLYEVLKNILTDPGQLRERGIASRAYVEKYHDAGKIAYDIYSVMKDLKNVNP